MSLINDALKRANKAPRRNPPPAPPLGNLQPVERVGGGGSSYLIPGLLIAVLLMAGIFFGLWWRSNKGTNSMAGYTPAANPPAMPSASVKPVTVAPVASMPKPAPAAPANSGLVPTKFGIKISTNLVVRTNAVKPVVADLNTLTVASATSASAASNPETVTPSPAAAVTTTTEPSSSTVVALPPATVTTTTTSTSSLPAPATEPAPSVVATGVPVAPLEAPKVVPPPPPAKPQFPTVKLQGIFYRTTSPSVLINGRTLRTGDKVEGVKVIKIERESVMLEWGGETKVLSIDQ